MKDKQIIEAMAELDDIKGTIYPEDGVFVNGPFTGELPDYLNSHDACQRVIDGLSDYDCSNVFNELYQMYNHRPDICERSRLVLKATPRQKCQAILKAKGLWVGEEI